jgi:hypothetical protein
MNIGVLPQHYTASQPRRPRFEIGAQFSNGRPGFDSWQRLGFLLFATASRPALRFIQPPIQWVSGIKRPEREAVLLPPFSAKINNVWSYTSTPIRLHGVTVN